MPRASRRPRDEDEWEPPSESAVSSDEVGRRRRGARTPAQPNPRHNAPPCTALPAKAVRVGCCRAPAAFRRLSSRPSRRGWSPHRLPLGQTMSMLPLACAPALCAPVAGNVKLACAAAGAAGSLPAPCRTQYMAADNPHPARPRRQLDTARQARMGCLSDLTASCPTPTPMQEEVPPKGFRRCVFCRKIAPSDTFYGAAGGGLRVMRPCGQLGAGCFYFCVPSASPAAHVVVSSFVVPTSRRGPTPLLARLLHHSQQTRVGHAWMG